MRLSASLSVYRLTFVQSVGNGPRGGARFSLRRVMEAPDGADAALPARVRVRINCAKLLLAEVDPRDKERNSLAQMEALLSLMQTHAPAFLASPNSEALLLQAVTEGDWFDSHRGQIRGNISVIFRREEVSTPRQSGFGGGWKMQDFEAFPGYLKGSQ